MNEVKASLIFKSLIKPEETIQLIHEKRPNYMVVSFFALQILNALLATYHAINLMEKGQARAFIYTPTPSTKIIAYTLAAITPLVTIYLSVFIIRGLLKKHDIKGTVSQCVTAYLWGGIPFLLTTPLRMILYVLNTINQGTPDSLGAMAGRLPLLFLTLVISLGISGMAAWSLVNIIFSLSATLKVNKAKVALTFLVTSPLIFLLSLLVNKGALALYRIL